MDRRRGDSGSELGLLERDGELALIASLLDEVAAGSGRILVIEGGPGIGKSALLWEARRLAGEQGFRNLGARCDELEDSIAFGLASQLLTAPLQRARPRERAELLDGAAARTAPLLLGVSLEGGQAPAPLGDPGQAMLGGLTWLVDNLATRAQLTLLIDDAQWADRESLRWLNHLAKRLAELPVLIALTVRRGESTPAAEPLAALAAAPEARVLQPSALSATAAGRVLAARLGSEPSPGLVEAAHEVTSGNPLMLDSLARELLDENVGTGARATELARRLVPDSLIRTVLLRLRALPEGAVPIAEALTILGDAPAEMVIELSGLDVDQAETGIEALQAAELIAGGADLAFTHPIIRSTIYEQISPRRRHRRHVEAARLLEQAGEAPERIAPHLIAGGDSAIPGGAEILVEAGRRVYALGAPEATVRYLVRALELDPEPALRAETLLQLGAAAIRALDRGAIDHLRAAVEAAQTTQVRRAALMELARARLTVLDMDGAAETFSLAAAESAGDRDLELSADAELASAQVNLSQAHAAFERLARYGTGPDGQTVAERKLLAVMAFAAVQGNAPRSQVLDLARRALGDGDLVAEQSCASLIVVELLFALVMTDAYELAEPTLDGVIADARERGWPIGFAMASTIRAWMNLRRGDLITAESDARAADDVRILHGATPLDPFVTSFLASLLTEQGRPDEALELIADRCPDPIPDAAVFQLALLARARARAALGSREEALSDLLEVGERELRFAAPTPAAMPWRSEAAQQMLALEPGRGAEAESLIADELELARAGELSRATGIALRARAVAGSEDPIADLHASIEQLRSGGAKVELARSLLHLGAALRHDRRAVEARSPLQEAVDLAAESGATELLQRAGEELAATGETRRSLSETGVAALTPSELRTARMAASGRTNREIADDLFVTPRTIEAHLTSAYRKLGIRSRKQLAEVLAGA
jgi:DNA-binding CsgD family transcriptional regulator